MSSVPVISNIGKINNTTSTRKYGKLTEKKTYTNPKLKYRLNINKPKIPPAYVL